MLETYQPPPIHGGEFYLKPVISMDQFDTTSLEKLFKLAEHMRCLDRNIGDVSLVKAQAVLLFYEPSTRTRVSFEIAIKQIGGQPTVVTDPQHFSSVSKGESFGDTIQAFAAYSDLIVLRHPEKGSAAQAAAAIEANLKRMPRSVPIVNAGDGIGEHPTQAMLDLYTIWRRFGRLENLNVVCVGDIKNGRTIHSLLRGLSLYKGNTAWLLSPPQLQLDSRLADRLITAGLQICEIDSLEMLPPVSQVWYWTRVQRERFTDHTEYEQLSSSFVLTNEVLAKYGDHDLIIMHPLPRVGEISEEVDKDPRAEYLGEQIRAGKHIRMALVAMLLNRDLEP